MTVARAAHRTKMTAAHNAVILIAGLATLLLTTAPAAADPIQIEITTVRLNPENRGQTTVGALTLLAGFALTAGDDRFGGLSGLHIDADGARMLTVGDHGIWLEATLIHDADGVLTGVTGGHIRPILDHAGRPVVAQWRDAEEVAALPDDRWAVSFERRHRIWLYPATDPAGGRPEPLAMPAELSNAPNNGGIEAMTVMADGRLLAITESTARGNVVPGWLISPDSGKAEALSYQRTEDFFPTAMATLAGGDVLVLERRYSVTAGAGMRLVRIDRATIVPGAVLSGAELARLGPPLSVDNFEGLAVRQTAAGETLVYILSDDNFNPLQRTLLLQFRLAP